MEVPVLNNQSLFDIALQVYGSAEAAFTLALENGLTVTDDLTSGEELQFSQANMSNRRVVDFYRINIIKPATGLTNESPVVPPIGHKIFDITFDYTFE